MARRARWWKLCAWSAVLCSSLVLSFATTVLAEAPRAARWIGQDTVIYAELTNPDSFLDQLQAEPVQALLATIPGYAKGLENEKYGQFRMVADVLAKKLETTPGRLLRDLTAGGLVLAVEADEGKAPHPVLIVTPKNADLLRRAHETLLELARQDAAAKGNPDPVKTVECRGLTVYAIGPKGAYALVDGSLVLGEPGEPIQAVINRALDGPKAGGSIADDVNWRAGREAVGPDTVAFGYVRLERLRKLDPKKFAFEQVPAPATLFFGSWVEVLRQAPWLAADVRWSGDRLEAELSLPPLSGGFPERLKGFVPPHGSGAPGLLNPPGTIATLGLWRDLTAEWESRAELFSPQEVQNLAKLDTFAGQFFGGRDFGSGVLGAFGHDWRLVIALPEDPAPKPVPDVRLPGYALVARLKPGDEEFSQRLTAAFQSFVGLANLGAAQKKAPPLMLGTETCDGVTISTARYLPEKPAPGDDGPTPVHQRFNYSPSAAQVGEHYILSSTVGLTRALIGAIKSPGQASDATLAVEADGPALARLIALNQDRVVMKNMLDKGHDKTQAETEVAALVRILEFLGHGRLTVRDNAQTVRLRLNFALGAKATPIKESAR